MLGYLDCFSGISGDMLLGALVDAGWPLEQLQAVVDRLKIGDVRVEAQQVEKQGISATWLQVIAPHEQAHRHRSDLVNIIAAAGLPDHIEERAVVVVDALAQAESKVHNVPVEQIHFHEVGAVDTIVDIVGAITGLHEMGIDNVHCSVLPWSHGTVKAAHGVLPVPPPAVVELLQGIPVIDVDVRGELVTPTGAALVRVLAESFGPIPAMTLQRVAYGAGTRDLPNRANVMRLVVGDAADHETGLKSETLTVLACNIDDANPEWLGTLPETLLKAGALDVWLSPTYMKKNRPATVIEVLCPPQQARHLRDLLLRHTTTLGVREHAVTRHALPRHRETVQTRYGPVQVKFAQLPDGTTKFSPEHDDCVRLANENNVSVREVWLAAIQAVQA